MDKIKRISVKVSFNLRININCSHYFKISIKTVYLTDFPGCKGLGLILRTCLT